MKIGVVLFFLSGRAVGAELQVDLGPTLKKSTWRDDFGGGFHLHIGIRFLRVLSIDTSVWEEVHDIDTRETTGLIIGAGATIPLQKVRPFLRAYFIHQHEQALVSVVRNPIAAIVGVGDGIRHRAGFGFLAGVEWPFFRKNRWELYFAPGFNATVFPDVTLGPIAYFGIIAAFGFNFRSGGESP